MSIKQQELASIERQNGLTLQVVKDGVARRLEIANLGTVIRGTGVPNGFTGIDGDHYIDTSAQMIYGPKTAGAWGSGASLLPQPLSTGDSPSFNGVTVASASSGAAHAELTASVSAGSSGDAKTVYRVDGGGVWALGVDNSDSDAWVLSRDAALGTNNVIRVSGNRTHVRFPLLVGDMSSTLVNYGLRIGGTVSASDENQGAISLASLTFNATATNSIYGINVSLTTPNTSFTTGSVYGHRIAMAKGSSHTITNFYGLKIEDAPVAGASYSLYTGTGTVRLGGPVGIKTSTLDQPYSNLTRRQLSTLHLVTI